MLKFKKIFLISLLILLFIASPAISTTQSYFVTQNGNGSDPDCSGGGAPNCSGAWDVSDFNSSSNWSSSDSSSKIDPGDYVYFSGTIEDHIRPPEGFSASSSNKITLDGWYGGTCNPVANMEKPYGYHTGSNNSSYLQDDSASWTSNVVGMVIRNVTDGSSCEVTSQAATTLSCPLGGGDNNKWNAGDLYALDVGGNDPTACPGAAILDRDVDLSWTGIDTYAIALLDNDHFIIQDFNITGNRGIYARGPRDGVFNHGQYLTIRRNYIHDLYRNAIAILGDSPDWNGMDFTKIGGADGDGNYIYDCQQICYDGSYQTGYAVRVGCADDYMISYNFIGNNPYKQKETVSGLLRINSNNRTIIEKNTFGYPHGGAAIAFKEWSGKYNIVRKNVISGAVNTGGILIDSNERQLEDFYGYANVILDSTNGLFVTDNFDDVYFWSNLIHNLSPKSGGTDSYGVAVVMYPYDAITGDVYIVGNTIARVDMAGSSSYKDSGIHVNSWGALKIWMSNNILYYNASQNNDRQISFWPGAEAYLQEIKNNALYSDGTPHVYYNSSDRHVSYINDLDEGSSNTATNPVLKDPDGADGRHGTFDDDYSLDSSSPVLTTGKDYEQCFYPTIFGQQYTVCMQEAIAPSGTDITAIPPVINTGNWTDLPAWGIGAFIAGGPDISLVSPVAKEECPALPNVSVTVQVVSEDTINCRYESKATADCDTEYDNLNYAFTTNQGTVSPSVAITQACGGNTSYIVKCEGVSSGFPSNCLEVLVDVAGYLGKLSPINIVYDATSSRSIVYDAAGPLRIKHQP